MSKETASLVHANAEMRGRFIQLLDSLSALRALADLDLESHGLEAVLDDALRVLMQHQDLERSAIFMLEEDGLRCRAGIDFPALFLMDVERGACERAECPSVHRWGEGLVGMAASTRTPQHSPDCAREARTLPEYREGTRPVGSLLCAPVIHANEVLGVVTVHHPEAHHFQSWHEHLLVLFCAVLGHLLSSHQVVERLERAVAERTRQL